MIELIVGIAMSVITQIAKKTEVDAKIIILWLSIITGVVFYFVKESYPEMVDKIYEKTLGAYAVSQVIYNYGISLWEKKKKEDLDTKKE